ncbi:MAG: hypothetical protein MPW15_21680 [Candidatus Manganitrophus sp.]|nr:hypothetical protein [Candidatus Manganitrophus sp.]
MNGEKLEKRTDQLRKGGEKRDLRVACLEKDRKSAEIALPDARHDRKKETISNGKLKAPFESAVPREGSFSGATSFSKDPSKSQDELLYIYHTIWNHEEENKRIGDDFLFFRWVPEKGPSL